MMARKGTSRAVVSARLRLADTAETLLRRRDPLTPPRRLNFVGDSDFQATGEEFLGHFRELARLQPSDRVLDIGCGIGRMARVLARELRPPKGSYDGFDIVREGISWCQTHYEGRTSVPFRFTHVDLYNSVYNPDGDASASEFRFPYPDGSFDLAIATSVFTHLLEDAADHYLAESARVLVSGGRLLATWFLIDRGRPPDASAALSFSTNAGAALVADPTAPESAVAYEMSWLRERLNDHGLRLSAPVFAGSWSGQSGRSFQDIAVLQRSG